MGAVHDGRCSPCAVVVSGNQIHDKNTVKCIIII